MEWLSQILSGLVKPLQWWIVIAPWEEGVRVRLGKTSKKLCPGIHFRIPWLDRVYVQSTRIRILTETGQTITTADGKVLTLAVNVEFRISDVQRMFLSVSDPEMVILGKVAGLVAELVSTTSSEGLTPKKIEEHASGKISADEWGLSGIKVMVTNFAYVRTYRLLQNDYRSVSMGGIEGYKSI